MILSKERGRVVRRESLLGDQRGNILRTRKLGSEARPLYGGGRVHDRDKIARKGEGGREIGKDGSPQPPLGTGDKTFVHA